MVSLWTRNLEHVCKEMLPLSMFFPSSIKPLFLIELCLALCLWEWLVPYKWKDVLPHFSVAWRQLSHIKILVPWFWCTLLLTSQHISRYPKSWFSMLSNTTAVSTFLSKAQNKSVCLFLLLFSMRYWRQMGLWQAEVFSYLTSRLLWEEEGGHKPFFLLFGRPHALF